MQTIFECSACGKIFVSGEKYISFYDRGFICKDCACCDADVDIMEYDSAPHYDGGKNE